MKLAEKHGIDLAGVTPMREGGTITTRDVRAAVRAQEAEAATPARAETRKAEREARKAERAAEEEAERAAIQAEAQPEAEPEAEFVEPTAEEQAEAATLFGGGEEGRPPERPTTFAGGGGEPPPKRPDTPQLPGHAKGILKKGRAKAFLASLAKKDTPEGQYVAALLAYEKLAAKAVRAERKLFAQPDTADEEWLDAVAKGVRLPRRAANGTDVAMLAQEGELGKNWVAGKGKGGIRAVDAYLEDLAGQHPELDAYKYQGDPIRWFQEAYARMKGGDPNIQSDLAQFEEALAAMGDALHPDDLGLLSELQGLATQKEPRKFKKQLAEIEKAAAAEIAAARERRPKAVIKREAELAAEAKVTAEAEAREEAVKAAEKAAREEATARRKAEKAAQATAKEKTAVAKEANEIITPTDWSWLSAEVSGGRPGEPFIGLRPLWQAAKARREFAAAHPEDVVAQEAAAVASEELAAKIRGKNKPTLKQYAKAHAEARRLGWLEKNQKGRMVAGANYRRLAKMFTGKRSMKDMTRDEASEFIGALSGAVVPPGKSKAPLPRRMGLVPKKLAEKFSPLMKDIGLLEWLRPAWRVFEKMGLRDEWWSAMRATNDQSEHLAKIVEEALAQQKTLSKKNEYSDIELFESLDTGKTDALSPAELKVYRWGKELFDKWADDLNIPPEKRRKNYVYHIFDAATKEYLNNKHPFPVALVRVFDEFATAKSVRAPFMEKREVNLQIGLVRSFWRALDAYAATYTRKLHFDPVIQQLRTYEKLLVNQPNAAKYMREFTKRLTGRQGVTDRLLNQTLKTGVAPVFEAMGMPKVADWLTQGNGAAKLAHLWTGVHYMAYMGFYPVSIVKNGSQQLLTIAQVGIDNYAWARKAVITEKELVQRVLAKSELWRSRKQAYLPALDAGKAGLIPGVPRAMSKFQEIVMWGFRRMDTSNVSNAIMAGYREAIKLGLPFDWAVKRGDEVGGQVQYIYAKMASAAFTQNAVGRVLSMFTTWPTNFIELASQNIQGRPSKVYAAYEKETGQKVNPEGWLARHKAMLRYMSIFALMTGIGAALGFRGKEYTGYGSLESVARASRGELAGLEVFGEITSLAIAVSQGDMKGAKRWAKRLRPDRKISIVRTIEDVAAGKKSWVRAFMLTSAGKDSGIDFDAKRGKRVMRLTDESVSDERIAALFEQLALDLTELRALLRKTMREIRLPHAERRARLARLQERWRSARRRTRVA